MIERTDELFLKILSVHFARAVFVVFIIDILATFRVFWCLFPLKICTSRVTAMATFSYLFLSFVAAKLLGNVIRLNRVQAGNLPVDLTFRVFFYSFHLNSKEVVVLNSLS